MPLPEQSGGYTLKTVDQLRDSHFRRIVDKQMHMVSFTIELYKLGLEVATNIGEYVSHIVKDFFSKHAVAIFSYKDQVDMHIEYTMSAMSDIACICHRPIV